MDWLNTIQRAFQTDRVLYSQHAKKEMEKEEFGLILDQEVNAAVQRGEIIQQYPDEKPYPCVLLYGRTHEGRPIHIVCAVCSEEESVVIVTVYEPDPARWIDFRQRRPS